ncbi:hypothetical protein GCM10028796_33060 [Ramlibacter monticola]
MFSAAERPHIVKGPNFWLSDLRDLLYGQKAAADPMQMENREIALVKSLSLYSAEDGW